MNKKYLLAVVASTLMFAACGDEVTEIHQDGMAVLEAGEKLSKQACDTANVGEMLFVMDSSEAFICDGESWQTLKGVDGKNVDSGAAGAGCSAKPVKNKAGRKGVEVSCGETVVDTIWNGEKGENGKPGDPGDAGTSCTAKSVKNKSGLEGLEVTCGKTVVDTIWNGKAGESGDDGVGCSLKDDGDGKVTVTCGDGDDATTATLYKAVCGTKPYDPAKSFCSEGKLYSCDDKPYDPKKQYCKLGSTVEDYGWLTDTRDKQIYKTVKICNDETSTCQTWMAENLNFSVNPGKQSWCGGGDKKNEGDCSVYGRLYTWAAAIDSVTLANDAGNPQTCGYLKTCTLPTVVQGVCPEGWHLPSTVEWNALFTAVGGTSYAGQKLKADSDLWHEGTSNDDSFGFAVLPAGDHYRNDSFEEEGYKAHFWSSTEYGDYEACIRSFYNDIRSVALQTDSKKDGFSVRCLRDSN